MPGGSCHPKLAFPRERSHADGLATFPRERGTPQRLGALEGSATASGEWSLEGDQDALHASRSHAALHVDGRDRSELPALTSVLVQDLLQLVAGHLAADHPLADLLHLVLVTPSHRPLPSPL